MVSLVEEILQKMNRERRSVAAAKKFLYSGQLNNNDRHITEEYVREKELAIKSHNKCFAIAREANPKLFEV